MAWEVVIHSYETGANDELEDIYEWVSDHATREEAKAKVRELNAKYPRCGAFPRPKE